MTIIERLRLRGALGRQIVIRMFIVFMIAMVINGWMVEANSMADYVTQQRENAFVNMEYLEKSIRDYDSFEWLEAYWLNHLEQVKDRYRDYMDPDSIHIVAKRLVEMSSGDCLQKIPVEELEQFSPEDQETFAVICYANMLSMFDSVKRMYKPVYFYAVRTSHADTEGYYSSFLFSGTTENEKRTIDGGDIFSLGEQFMWDGNAYPVMADLTEGKQVESLYDKINSEDNDTHYMVYRPVYLDEKLDFIICMELSDGNMRKQIRGKIFFIETISSLILFVTIFMIYYYLRLRVVKPIQLIQEGIRTFARNKDVDATKAVLSNVHEVNNEIGILKNDLLAMTVEMIRYTDQIERMAKEKERLDTELQVASTIQSDMLPCDFEAFRRPEWFDIYAMMIPAKEVGGDFYDYFKIDDDHIGLSVADVSGKGVPAALFMVVAKTLIRQNCMLNSDPAEVMYRVNNQLCENNKESLFVTAWLGIYELSTGVLRAVNAGHEYPVISRAGQEYELINDDHGLYLGALEDMDYSTYELQLNKGDTLFLYSDGVPEATNSEEQLFDVERMVASLSAHRDEELKELLVSVKRDIDAFVDGAPQFDDITMMAFRVQ